MGRWKAGENREKKIRELCTCRLAMRGRDTHGEVAEEEKIENQVPGD